MTALLYPQVVPVYEGLAAAVGAERPTPAWHWTVHLQVSLVRHDRFDADFLNWVQSCLWPDSPAGGPCTGEAFFLNPTAFSLTK